jgi:hypothetical protein
VVPKAGALPGEDGRRLNEDQNLPPAGPASGHPGPQNSIATLYASPSDRPVIERQLVSQRQNLHLEGQARAEDAGDEREPGRMTRVRRRDPYTAEGIIRGGQLAADRGKDQLGC